MQTTPSHILLTILVALSTAGAMSHFMRHQAAPGTVHESAFSRVIRTGTLRCAYIPYAPEMIVDPSTKKLSGFVYDIVEAIGKAADLKIAWTEEVSVSTMFEGLHMGRYDAVCAGLFEKVAQARQAVFTTPVDYSASYVYTRTDNTRLSPDIATLNRPEVTVAVIDGEISATLASSLFPKAKVFALPQTVSSPVEALTAVASGKADIAFSQKAVAETFIAHNPGQVRMVSPTPVSAYSQTVASFAPADVELKNFFDSAIRTLYANGVIPEIFKKYDPQQLTYLLLKQPYGAENALNK